MFQMSEMERLLRLERMMTEAYDIALSKMNERELIETLARFRADHARNAEVIAGLVQRREGTSPELDEPFRRYVEEVLDTIDEAVRRDEALGELRIAEAALNMNYGQAMDYAPDDHSRRTLKECMQAEAEHLSVLSMASATHKT